MWEERLHQEGMLKQAQGFLLLRVNKAGDRTRGYPHRDTGVYVDASPYGLGTVLSHRVKDGSESCQ